MTALPPFAPFPEAPWRDHIVPVEWEACLSNWVALAEAHLSLSADQFSLASSKDESLLSFLVSFMRETASGSAAVLGTSQSAQLLIRQSFLLVARFLRIPSPPPPLLQWEVLSDFCHLYSKRRTSNLITQVSQNLQVTSSLNALKKSLIVSLDAGLKSDLNNLESRLKRLNHLIHASPDIAAFFLAGSDFVDGLISCFKIMNPPLRKAIVTTAYLSLIGLTEGDSPKFSMLTDQLYSLKAAADGHKAGPLNVNDSMVAELVTVTPILKQVQRRLEDSGSNTTRGKSVITALGSFRKPGGGSIKPKKLVKRKIDKGKGIMTEDDEVPGEMKMHRMSQISQIQDLFPDLGSGFISKLLDEFGDNTEQVVAHLLEDDLPPHLATVDRTKELSPERSRRKSRDIAPRPTPPQVPIRHNVFDDDEFDKLEVDLSNLHFGKRNPDKSAEDILNDRSSAPNKAAILSALSAFDADDDERDDTYDAADAGLVVDDGNANDPEDQKKRDAGEEALFKAYQSDPKVFDRDAVTRRSQPRNRLKQQTGMTDEAIEGWALMLARTPNQMRQLEMKYSAFGGDQPVLASTAWRASPAESAAEDSEVDGRGGNTRGGPRGRGGQGGQGSQGGRGRGRGGRGRGGNVAGPPGEQDTRNAQRNKEANKGSRANHNRRNQRAKKMARGGFPG
ncbi:uncharacterized protein GGS22DRAFT_121034 [Annulohypoxylon maeteangense]|uniref:uncharacterized protein n=1 Tax=Annulohypoxylon maeteangense TaxID=1927788 RepID=UPI0020076C64|nr:uncharacterized protein GGS22DRAFT_121034 [Annulohypoxylon maeteangense]KAI0887065.1 hypothetical protein GGS22DRAFT_121034 [Annulohypoxylon maeteangense]